MCTSLLGLSLARTAAALALALAVALKLLRPQFGLRFAVVVVVDAVDKSKRHLSVSTMATTSTAHELTNQTMHDWGLQGSGLAGPNGPDLQQSVLCCSSGKRSLWLASRYTRPPSGTPLPTYHTVLQLISGQTSEWLVFFFLLLVATAVAVVAIKVR